MDSTTPASGPPAGIDPEATTGWTLVRTHHAMARRFTETLARAGLTPTQFGVLVQLVQQPGISQADLARRVLMTPQSMGELLTGLHRTGHVQRTAGRRGTATTITITDTGRAALRTAAPLVAQINQPSALGLTPEEDATLNALLHKVRRGLNDTS